MARPSVLRVPDLDGNLRPIRAGRGDALAVGVPGHGEDKNRMAGEFDDHLPGRRVPDFREPAITGRNNRLAVGAHRHAPEFLAVVGEGGFLALVPPERGRVPDADGPVGAGRGEAPAVRAEHHTPATAGMAAEAEHFPAGRRVPDVHGLVLAG